MASAKNGLKPAEKAERARAKRAAAEERAASSGLEKELAAVVQASPPPPPEPIPAPRRYTIAEVREQVRDVEELLIEGARVPVIYRVLRETKHPTITRARVGTLVARVQNDWATLAKDDERLAMREAAIRRIQRMRQIASGERNPGGKGWAVPPNHAAVKGYEELLVKLQGTAEAIKVDVDVRYTSAMLEVVGSLTGEMASEYLEEALEQRRLADVARRELPALVVEARAKLAGDPASVSHDAE